MTYHDYRLIAIMSDGTTVTKDFDREREPNRALIYWFDSYEVVQRANVVLCVNLRSGATEVLKNRWGATGVVAKEFE